LIGVLSAAITLGVGEAIAAFVRPAASPVIAVGNRIIVLTPESAKRATINSVGTGDKALLLASIYVLLAVLGAAIGGMAMTNLRAGLAGVLVVGAFAVYCELTANGARGSDALPALGGTLAGALALVLLVRVAHAAGLAAEDDPDRRWFLRAAIGAGALATISGLVGRAAQAARFDVSAARRKVRLPPATGERRAPTDADLGRSPVPWVTSSNRFYRIDTALRVPQVDPDTWRLRIHGEVEHERALTYADVLARPQIRRWITLCCVSNSVGGPLVGNALWQGIRLADLIRECGIKGDADQLLLRSVDGYTFGAPVAAVLDGRDALLAVGMNGRPLPIEHGFPARTVIPGLYGYVSACKWITGIEVTYYQDKAAYWVQEGWDARPSIKLASRIDTPRAGGSLKRGEQVAIAGVAWDQHVGVSKVQVQIDGEAWQTARLATVPSADTWRQWLIPWTPQRAGTVRLRVRAFDAHGVPQTQHRADAFPSGATGLHEITVRVSG
jgi:DMSO/TMAO reductase YedYZ molybdopterin-dependent catalytic subunit